MTLVLAYGLPICALVLVVAWRRRRAARKLCRSPLAGMDTGFRSPWRTPGRAPHRGY